MVPGPAFECWRPEGSALPVLTVLWDRTDASTDSPVRPVRAEEEAATAWALEE